MNPALESESTPLPQATMPRLTLGQAHPGRETPTNSPNDSKVPGVALSASDWFVFVDDVHGQGGEALAGGGYESILDEHRFVLSALIKDGEQLVLAAKQDGIEPRNSFTLLDLEATVESLHVVFHAQHRNGNSRAEKDQINKLFDVKTPGH